MDPNCCSIECTSVSCWGRSFGKLYGEVDMETPKHIIFCGEVGCCPGKHSLRLHIPHVSVPIAREEQRCQSIDCDLLTPWVTKQISLLNGKNPDDCH
jgi:hypothetical protein